MSFSNIFKRMPSFGRKPLPRRNPTLPSVDSDGPSDNFYTAFEHSVESIPDQSDNLRSRTAEQSENVGPHIIAGQSHNLGPCAAEQSQNLGPCAAEQNQNLGPCAAELCARAGECYTSSSEGEAEEGQCVFSYDEPTSSIFYVSLREDAGSDYEVSSLSSCSESIGSHNF